MKIQRGRATVTGFSLNRKSDLGVVFLFSDFGARNPQEISACPTLSVIWTYSQTRIPLNIQLRVPLRISVARLC